MKRIRSADVKRFNFNVISASLFYMMISLSNRLISYFNEALSLDKQSTFKFLFPLTAFVEFACILPLFYIAGIPCFLMYHNFIVQPPPEKKK